MNIANNYYMLVSTLTFTSKPEVTFLTQFLCHIMNLCTAISRFNIYFLLSISNFTQYTNAISNILIWKYTKIGHHDLISWKKKKHLKCPNYSIYVLYHWNMIFKLILIISKYMQTCKYHKIINWVNMTYFFTHHIPYTST